MGVAAMLAAGPWSQSGTRCGDGVSTPRALASNFQYVGVGKYGRRWRSGRDSLGWPINKITLSNQQLALLKQRDLCTFMCTNSKHDDSNHER